MDYILLRKEYKPDSPNVELVFVNGIIKTTVMMDLETELNYNLKVGERYNFVNELGV